MEKGYTSIISNNLDLLSRLISYILNKIDLLSLPKSCGRFSGSRYQTSLIILIIQCPTISFITVPLAQIELCLTKPIANLRHRCEVLGLPWT